jgi:hypothetical protein
MGIWYEILGFAHAGLAEHGLRDGHGSQSDAGVHGFGLFPLLAGGRRKQQAGRGEDRQAGFVPERR